MYSRAVLDARECRVVLGNDVGKIVDGSNITSKTVVLSHL